ncbi:hypothetical protein Ocin01_07457 [Orchesella cincta]|uniref:Uncharacterized protein n=1 Tax=Orchesella cincta TaxID=48709 RepID=A0A1D2N1R9_ORCCI|nr:hypothetical protein Ocin01_07457 [Orchesella cincta]
MTDNGGLNCSVARDDGDGEGEEQQAITINREVIQRATVEIKRSYSRSRRVRLKLLAQIKLYFEEIASIVIEDNNLTSKVIQYIHDYKELIVETTNLCLSLSHPCTRIYEVCDLVFDLGTLLEQIIVAVFNWCLTNDKLLGEIAADLFEALIKVSADNPEAWQYTSMVSPMVLTIVNAIFDPGHEEFRREWAVGTLELMKETSKAVFKCGDFYCQYYLMQIITAWIEWTSGADALALINSMFSFVDVNARRHLMTEVDIDVRLRLFLNSMNLSKKGPKVVIPIQCLYLFICDTEIGPPQHVLNSGLDFWVDFSIVSERIHAFYSIPEAPLLSLSIRSDQIDSVCLNWVVNDGQSQIDSEDIGADTQSSSTFKKNEKVLFFHVVLSVDFEEISNDVEALRGTGNRSMYFVFRDGELVEKVMKEMGYHQHMCGSKNCQRPKALRRLLADQNKLSYSQNWCPESQVYGLDETFMSGTARSGAVTPTSDNRAPRTPVSPRRISQRTPTPRRTLKKPSTPATPTLDRTPCSRSSSFTTTPRSISQRTPRRALRSLRYSNPSTPISDGTPCSTARSISQRTPRSMKLSSVSSRSETDSAFYVSVSSGEENDSMGDEDISLNGSQFNATYLSTDTFYENPLPRSARRVLSDASVVRNSSPIHGVVQAPFSPAVSVFDNSFKSCFAASPQSDRNFDDRRSKSPEFGNCGTADSLKRAKNDSISISIRNSISQAFGFSRIADSPKNKNDNDCLMSPEFGSPTTVKSPQTGTRTSMSHEFVESPQVGTRTLMSHEFVESPQIGTQTSMSHAFGSPTTVKSPQTGTRTSMSHAFGSPETVKPPQSEKNDGTRTSKSHAFGSPKTVESPQSEKNDGTRTSKSHAFGSPETVEPPQSEKNDGARISKRHAIGSPKTVEPPQSEKSDGARISASSESGITKAVDSTQRNENSDDSAWLNPKFVDAGSQKSPQNAKNNLGRSTESRVLGHSMMTEDSFKSPNHDCDSNGWMSPVFGYSRTLVNEPISQTLESVRVSALKSKSPTTPSLVNPLQPLRKSNEKVTCYAYAHQEMKQRQQIKLQTSADYDPYDILTCSEFEEFFKKMFPKIKTYTGKKKPPAKRRRVTLPAVSNNEDLDSDFQPSRRTLKKRKTEPVLVGDNAPTAPRKFKSFSKSRS